MARHRTMPTNSWSAGARQQFVTSGSKLPLHVSALNELAAVKLAKWSLCPPIERSSFSLLQTTLK